MLGLGVYLAIGAGLYVGGLGLVLVRRGPRSAAAGVLLMLLASMTALVAAWRRLGLGEEVPLAALLIVAVGTALVLVLIGLTALRTGFEPPEAPEESP